ncbi:hypothetical protein GCM10007907_24960 [Chitinimonas prasina]|uniref:Transcriptional regulator n=1 Tax=Chitinimonas prasina TaxID=1434937 RepID=A0ABQ5YGK2_9NEIS|nr:hypothetical protein GCM10007907_24960 [Chitinimonas prasina]
MKGMAMAKQKEDAKTVDMFPTATVRGRPRVHADAAAKQRAYRLRVKKAKK